MTQPPTHLPAKYTGQKSSLATATGTQEGVHRAWLHAQREAVKDLGKEHVGTTLVTIAILECSNDVTLKKEAIFNSVIIGKFTGGKVI